MSTDTSERALRAVERLIKVADTVGDQQTATRLRARMINRMKAVPMTEIIAQFRPGDTIPQKAKALGVSRQTIHYWLDGRMRPRVAMARKLEKFTDFSFAEIRGLSETS